MRHTFTRASVEPLTGDDVNRNVKYSVIGIDLQEAQLPQRNSASAAHVEGARPSSPLPLRPLWLHLCVWSNSKAQRTYVKRAVH